MFPTDRWSWSSQDGTEHLPKESFKLPPNWEWEDDWYIDKTVPGDDKVNLIQFYHTVCFWRYPVSGVSVMLERYTPQIAIVLIKMYSIITLKAICMPQSYSLERCFNFN